MKLWCSAKALPWGATHRPGRVRPVLERAMSRSSRKRIKNSGSTSSSGPTVTIDEVEQLRIYHTKDASFSIKPSSLLTATVKRWRKSKFQYRHSSMKGAVMISEACRGLISVNVCRKIIGDATGNGRIILVSQEELILRRISKVYNEVVRRLEIARYHQDVLYGPANGEGILAFEQHLGL